MLEVLKDFQTLATGCLAIVAASIGFAGVWYAQRKTLENAERERRHREQMEKRRREEELGIRREAIISALSGELAVLNQRVGTGTQLMNIQRAIWEGFAKSYGDGPVDMGEKSLVRPTFDAPVFDEHVEQIGILPPALAYSVVKCYANLKGLGSTVQLDHKYPAMLAAFYKFYVAVLEGVSTEIHDTVLRLHAVRLGHPDPGIGKGEEFWKDRGDPEQFREDVSTAPSPQPAS
jgi:hypothetical protein